MILFFSSWSKHVDEALFPPRIMFDGIMYTYVVIYIYKFEIRLSNPSSQLNIPLDISRTN
jgi:hypothetical protein